MSLQDSEIVERLQPRLESESALDYIERIGMLYLDWEKSSSDKNAGYIDSANEAIRRVYRTNAAALSIGSGLLKAVEEIRTETNQTKKDK